MSKSKEILLGKMLYIKCRNKTNSFDNLYKKKKRNNTLPKVDKYSINARSIHVFDALINVY